MTTTTGRIHRATTTDIDDVTDVLADGFLRGDFAPWLVPDDDERARIYPGYFDISADHFLANGVVEVYGDFDAVAVWAYVDDVFDPVIDDYDGRLARACRRHTDRFRALDDAMHHNHPTGRPHDYLALLAVRRHRQGLGIGSRLLCHHHSLLDRCAGSAYLEATGPRNRALYTRHGYHDAGPVIPVADGPVLYPMWRSPAGTPQPPG